MGGMGKSMDRQTRIAKTRTFLNGASTKGMESNPNYAIAQRVLADDRKRQKDKKAGRLGGGTIIGDGIGMGAADMKSTYGKLGG